MNALEYIEARAKTDVFADTVLSQLNSDTALIRVMLRNEPELIGRLILAWCGGSMYDLQDRWDLLFDPFRDTAVRLASSRMVDHDERKTLFDYWKMQVIARLGGDDVS